MKTRSKVLIVSSLLFSIPFISAIAINNSSNEDYIKPVAAASGVGNKQAYNDGDVLFPDSLWSTPSSVRASDGFNSYGCTSYYIDSVKNSSGKTTKVFCYVGFPSGASASNKVPAVVLVHGGGGTAFSEWCQFWNNRGYAAIAMDTEGMVPSYSGGTYGKIDTDGQASPMDHGPENTEWRDTNGTTEQQWFYHATASVIASTSFIKSFDCVDTSRVGITGVSYGGYLTCLAASYYGNYSFAAPVYGGLDQRLGNTYFGWFSQLYQNGMRLWDNSKTLSNIITPFLSINGNVDNHFSAIAQTSMDKHLYDGRMIIKDHMPHSHYHGAVNGGGDINELLTFADYNSGINNANEFPKFRTQLGATNAAQTVVVSLPTGNAVTGATLYFTSDEKLQPNDPSSFYKDTYGVFDSTAYNEFPLTNQVTWSTSSCSYTNSDAGYISVHIPTSAKYAYLDVKFANGMKTSYSDYHISSHLVEFNTMPATYYEKLVNGNSSANFAYAQDANGWGTYHRDSDGVSFFDPYFNTHGDLIIGNYVGFYMSTYGSKSVTNTNRGGVSSITMEGGGYLANYKAFYLDEDIDFAYNYSTGNTADSGRYTIAFYDSMKDLLQATNNQYQMSKNEKIVIAGANKSCNYYGKDVNGKIMVNNIGSTYALKHVGSSATSNFNKIRIRVTTENTKVYLNNVLIQTLSLKRSNFRNGVAYMALSLDGNQTTSTVTFNFKMGKPVYLENSMNGERFTYDCDSHGWANYKQNGIVHYDSNGDARIGPTYGVTGKSTNGNITTMLLTGSAYVANYKEFDVTKPIAFSYNVSSADFAGLGKSWYMINLFDNMEEMFKANNSAYNITAYKTKLRLTGCNNQKSNDGIDRSAIYGKFQAQGPASENNLYTQYYFPSTFNASTWANYYYRCVINIGEDSTTVCVNNGTILTIPSLKRSSFSDGIAYLDVISENQTYMNFIVEDQNDLPSTCNVTFDSNGGSSVATQTVNYSSSCSKPSNPTKNYYNFSCWCSDSGLTKEYDFSKPVTGNITLYAKWVETTLYTFAKTYLHPEIPFTDHRNTGACYTYYKSAKSAFNNLSASDRSEFLSSNLYTDYKARLTAWAKANGDVFSGNSLIQGNNTIALENSGNEIAIILTLVSITSLILSSIVIFKKRKEN